MEDKKLNEQESLALIAGMIRNTQDKLERNAGIPFLVWGYTTVVLSVSIALLVRYTGSYQWQWLWFALPAIAWPLMLLLAGKHTKGVVTFVDKIISYVWAVFGLTGFMVSAVTIVMGLGSGVRLGVPIFFMIVLLMGMGTTLTGLIVKFKPCVWSGFISMILAFCSLFVHGLDTLYLFALVFLVMMVIPGHLLNAKAKKLNHFSGRGDV